MADLFDRSGCFTGEHDNHLFSLIKLFVTFFLRW